MKLAILKKNVEVSKHETFTGALRITKEDKKEGIVELENGCWYSRSNLVITNKGELEKTNKAKKNNKVKKNNKINVLGHDVNLDNVNTNLIIGEKDLEIQALNKECESYRISMKSKSEQIKALQRYFLDISDELDNLKLKVRPFYFLLGYFIGDSLYNLYILLGKIF